MPNANLLVIHQGALGDFILTFPAITQLQKYFKPIDVLCQHQLGKLAKALGLAQNWHAVETAYFASLFGGQIDQKIKTVLEKYDKIILFTLSEQLEQSIHTVAANLSCRLPPKPPPHQGIHVAKFALENIYDCGLIKKADAKLDDVPFPVRKDRLQMSHKILLHPGAGSVRKRWPIPNFLQLEAVLKAAGFEPQFVLGPAEKDLAEKLRHPNRIVRLLDDLLELWDLLNSAGGYIGNDSGASHLAAYSGLPATVIFGPADPKRWAPIGRAVQIVRPGLQCRPCFETEPANCDAPRCLADTDPQTVIEAFYNVYLNWQREPSPNLR